jgi:nitrate reductase gamma subunit
VAPRQNTVSLWFRSSFTGSPDVHAIASAPVMYQVHAAAAWAIFAVCHRVAARPTEPGTAGRRWRSIGVRY